MDIELRINKTCDIPKSGCVGADLDIFTYYNQSIDYFFFCFKHSICLIIIGVILRYSLQKNSCENIGLLKIWRKTQSEPKKTKNSPTEIIRCPNFFVIVKIPEAKCLKKIEHFSRKTKHTQNGPKRPQKGKTLNLFSLVAVRA